MPTSEKASAMEPPEIRQLRMQIHQNEEQIAAYTREDKKIQQQIAVFQGRVSLSPSVEEQYKGLTRDYENAQKNYQDLLANKDKADLTVKMTQPVSRRADDCSESRNPTGLAEFSQSLAFCRRRAGRGVWHWESGWRCGWNCAINRFAPRRTPKPLWSCLCWRQFPGSDFRLRTTETTSSSSGIGTKVRKNRRKRLEFKAGRIQEQPCTKSSTDYVRTRSM